MQIKTRFEQHKTYISKGQWEKSGIAQHSRECKSDICEAETIAVVKNTFDRRVRETLEIQKHKSGPREGGINHDDGMYVKTKFWMPLLQDISKKEMNYNEKRHRNKSRMSNEDSSLS